MFGIYIFCFLIFTLWGYVFFIRKNYLHVITFISLGIFIPVLLYQFNWSSLINTSESSMYVYVIMMIALISLVYTCFTYKKKPRKLAINEKIVFTKFGASIAPYMNILFIGLYLLENYMGSESIIPGLVGIDIHNKYSAPIISYITNASFLFIAFDYLAYKSTKKKKYLVFLAIIVFIPVITRSSRFVMVMALIQLLCLYSLFEKEKKEKTAQEKKKSKRRNRAIFCVLIALMITLNLYTNYRMSGYGKYDITYSKMTKWTGPDYLTWMSPFYGYFALSFNNLKINLLYRQVECNYLGIYSFASLYFGLFQIDNLFGVDGAGQIRGNLITSGSANVPTGFWDFYYDFGVLFFIPLIVALLICNYFFKKSCKEKNKITYRVMYCWYVTYFAFMSFQNSLFMSTSLVSGIIMFLIMKNSFEIIENEEKTY
ncbi:MAG: oligosaccharide repeat unit polymerase [Clostridia bacterium]|nr:oligosaccharide repeat unit polymerase [Clostridia bacterium]